MKNCFAKCCITDRTSEDEDDVVDEEFNELFNEFVDSECDMTAEEYVDFNVETCSSLPAFKLQKKDKLEKIRVQNKKQSYINDYFMILC